MRCLVVDDNDFVRAQTEFFLMGVAEIQSAANGKEAVEMFQRALAQGTPFDLVLLDVMMPELDGQQALKLMREAEKTLDAASGKKAVIIMTTALSSVDEMQEAIIEGDCSDYLVKPIGKDDLLAVLRRHEVIPAA